MKKFIVTEERLVTAIWTYEVEAETEAEALEQVQNGNITPNEMKVDDNWDWDENLSKYDVEELIDEGPEYDSAGFTEADRIVDGSYRVKSNITIPDNYNSHHCDDPSCNCSI